MSKVYMIDKKVRGVLSVVKKMPLSKMGNPKYRVKIKGASNGVNFPDDWDNLGEFFDTVDNDMLGFEITKYNNKKVVAQVRFLQKHNVIHNVIFQNTLDNDFSNIKGV
tara:strand:+ start:49 stop:372 length:324 start_codon:yes stop_codon:yes gene_type:complete